MEPKKTRPSSGPEAGIKSAIKRYMEHQGWLVIVTHGNAFQAGLPDLYCAHQGHGWRWVEVKYAGKYEFTRDQLRLFPLLAEKGIGIWVLALTMNWSPGELEIEYKKLWQPPNYHRYIGHTKKPF